MREGVMKEDQSGSNGKPRNEREREKELAGERN
jgi:hypothetical protein